MSTATQIVHLKRLALITSRHLPHNEQWKWANSYMKQYNEKRTKQELLDSEHKEHWLATYFFQATENTINSVSHLIGHNME